MNSKNLSYELGVNEFIDKPHFIKMNNNLLYLNNLNLQYHFLIYLLFLNLMIIYFIQIPYKI